MSENLTLSTLGHVWVLDLDGTIVKHNGYLIDGEDKFLDGALDFLNKIPDKDMVIFVTSREDKYRETTEAFLTAHNVRYDYIIFGAPYGERIVVNDRKNSGLTTAIALNVNRDLFSIPVVVENPDL